MQLPLEDVKVLDLTHALAGPFCSTMLADFGAQVIKLEPPGHGDIARGWGAPLPGGETAYFVSLHRGKRGIVVDLKKPEGKELFFRLVEKCDVVLENYRVDALKRLGLDYEAARRRTPALRLARARLRAARGDQHRQPHQRPATHLVSPGFPASIRPERERAGPDVCHRAPRTHAGPARPHPAR